MPGLDTNTKLLIHASKPPGFDEGLAGAAERSATFYGNATTVDTESVFPGGHALSLDGVDSYISIPWSDPLFAYGTANFTIDFWVKFNALPTAESSFDRPLYHANVESPKAYVSMNLGISSGVKYISFYCEDPDGSCYLEGDVTVSTGVWYHIAVVRNSSTFTLYLDGTSIGTTTFAGTVPSVGTNVLIGKDDWGGYTNAYFDDYRVTKGTALWTANFTPPTEPAVATYTDANHCTILLLPFYGPMFTDASASAHVITNTSAESVTADKKFGNCSIKLNTTPVYLTVADSDNFAFGTGDFTFDFWVKCINTTSTKYLWQQATDSSNKVEIVLLNTGLLYFFANSGGTTLSYVRTTASVISDVDTWHHVAVVRNGTGAGCVKLYVDGVSKTLDVYNDLAAGSIPNIAASPKIGGTGAAISCAALVDEFRVSDIARWTADFTPSSEEYAELIPVDITVELPSLICEIEATADVVTIITCDLPEISAEMFSGGIIEGELPALHAQIGIAYTATLDNILSSITAVLNSGSLIDETLSGIEVDLSAFTGRIATLFEQLPAIYEALYSGASVEAELPNIQCGIITSTAHIASIENTLPEITASIEAYTGFLASIEATLPSVTGVAMTGAYMDAQLPSIQCTVIGLTDTQANISDCILPALTGQMYSGASIDNQLGPIVCDIVSSHNIIADIDVTLPRITDEFISIVHILANIDNTLPSIVDYLHSVHDVNISCAVELPSITCDIVSVTGAMCTLECSIPSITAVISGIADALADIQCSIPSITASIQARVPAVRTTLHLNMLQKEVITSFTNYDFLSYAVINGRSVGGSADGFYVLEGSTDNGTNIDLAVVTPALSFGTYLMKKVRGFRLGGISSSKVIFTATDGITTWPVEISLVNQGKPKYALGYFTHLTMGDFLTFAMYNKNGADLFVTDVDLYMQVLEK